MNKSYVELPLFYHCGYFSGQKNIPNHSHHGGEIVYISKGNCINIVGDVHLKGAKGCLHILPPRCFHAQKNQGMVNTFFVTCSASSEFFDFSPRLIELDNEKWIPLWMNEIFQINETAVDKSNELSNGLLYLLLCRIKQIEGKRLKYNNMHPFVVSALQFMKEKLSNDIGEEDVAAFCHISVGYLSALFKEELGLPPMKHLQQMRMKQALHFLENCKLNISDIAKRCGYKNSNYFARLFKKLYQCTPSQYRKIFKERSINRDIDDFYCHYSDSENLNGQK